MFTLPAEVRAVCGTFTSLFTHPSWPRAQALLGGVPLAPSHGTITAALRALDLAAVRVFQARGRPWRKGRRLPTLAECLTLTTTRWRKVKVPWCGGARRLVEIATDTSTRCRSGLPPISLRWVLIRDPKGPVRLASSSLRRPEPLGQ